LVFLLSARATRRGLIRNSGETLEQFLRIESLSVEYRTSETTAPAVRDVSLELRKGETLGVVGESGSGKSTLGLAVLGLIPYPGRVTSGQIFFEGMDLRELRNDKMMALRGKRIAMIFQDPMTSLNPVKKIGDHFVEYMRTHESGLSEGEARSRTKTVLEDLGIPASRIDDYPHQFSGGMRQRVMIGLALALRPSLIIADEPTTALDVIVEAQILKLLRDLKTKYSLSLILITHNMGIVAEMADRVAVMYAGRMVEVAPTIGIFENPKHPYTQALLSSIPNIRAEDKILKTIPGSPPDLLELPPGCAFHPRCPFAFDRCRMEVPMPLSTGENSEAACFLLEGVVARHSLKS
jgi:oligopeptide/dipeptide ABC transporter ATP-binding protein